MFYEKIMYCRYLFLQIVVNDVQSTQLKRKHYPCRRRDYSFFWLRPKRYGEGSLLSHWPGNPANSPKQKPLSYSMAKQITWICKYSTRVINHKCYSSQSWLMPGIFNTIYGSYQRKVKGSQKYSLLPLYIQKPFKYITMFSCEQVNERLLSYICKRVYWEFHWNYFN